MPLTKAPDLPKNVSCISNFNARDIVELLKNSFDVLFSDHNKCQRIQKTLGLCT